MLIVSHKFSNIKKADYILVLKNGEIIESGSHQKLMSYQGEYARLYNIQSEAFTESS